MHVVVLGSQRSGTSMVTRMLNICGLYIGQPAETPVFNQSNPRGYWEHVGFCAVNEKVLRQLHGSFENPPDVLEGWEVDPSLDELYDEARALISRTFAGQDNWGWKIPKTVLTLPFWKRVVPDLKVVVCVRNPLDYGSSINAYRNVGRAHALQLWEYYNITALMYTVPAERHIVFYEDFFPDFHNALDPLLDFVGLRRVVGGSQTDKKIADFHDEALKHHNSNIDDLISAQDVSDLTKRLYCEMRGGPPDGSQVPSLREVAAIIPTLLARVRESGRESERNRAITTFRDVEIQRDHWVAKWAETEVVNTTLKEKINQITSSQSQLTVENDQLKAQLARLSTADARRQELEQILSSRSHRLATAVSSLRGRLIRKRHGKNPVI